ncbi:TBC1 domain family member 30 [Leptidea sinapis]|uniref:TBC1 domain family member 30 n=1 Tax=Leptidea sinapis TaxID=189913 RepID=UPI0021C3F52B|nr:TBC1 domain family member 30 [Leptidea sinapis]
MSAILNSLRNLASSSKSGTAGDTNARFGVVPGHEGPGEGGFAEWLHAMRLVARLPAGVPQHFRRKLWLTLSERHLSSRKIDWPVAERACFRGTAQPDDAELSAQILKDLHRTGCSLFCGTEGRENQAMLRRVLLAYARWNKDVGYCQGFNMLAAIILEVMEKSESDSLKVMVYLVEAVLPEGYFADDLRGLSADMAAFRDLLRLRLPKLARHMDYLQRISDGGGVEPPLPDVFTMQWFLTLYATWLPRDCLLRIWDLILLDGNEILLLTALAIWDMLQDRILSARSADEFYSCMGGGASAVYEAGDALVARVVAFNSAPELPRLRSLHRYRVTPPVTSHTRPTYHPPMQSAMQSMTKRGLRLFYSEDEGESSDDSNKMALATVMPRRQEQSGTGDRLSLDIGALKRQYARLRERQRQAHVILAAACARHAAVGVPTSPTSLTVNNLLLGKSAIVSSRGRRLGPPPGAVPPSRHSSINHEKTSSYMSSTSSETISWKEAKSRRSLERRNSVKWKDAKMDKALNKNRKASIDLDETGDGIIVSEMEANEMIAASDICSKSLDKGTEICEQFVTDSQNQ